VLPGQPGPLFDATGVASGPTVTGTDVAEQPLGLVTVTVTVEAVETTIDCVVAPVDQRFPVADDDVSVTEVPGQNVVGPLMTGVAGAALTVTLKATEVAEQPAAFVTVSVKEPAVETMIDCVVAPVDQRFPVADDEVRVVEPPAQNELAPLMTGVAGGAVTVTAKAPEVAEQPLAFVTATV